MYKMTKLIQSERQLWHTQDLAVLWGLANRNTLYTTVKRYVNKRVLWPIYKGLYATVPIERVDPLSLGVAMAHGYCYLSCETVLTRAGVISQSISALTFVSGISKRVTVDGNEYVFRKLDDKYLYNVWGIEEKGGGVMVATVERAVADMLYFNPRYYFDMREKVDWEKVEQARRVVGYL
jgi:hypothetical protein